MDHEHHHKHDATVPAAAPVHGASCCHPKTDEHGHKRRDWLFIVVSAIVLVSYIAWLVAADSIHATPFVGTFVHSVAEFINIIWWGILLGILAVAALANIPREWVISILGKPGTFGGIFRSVLGGLLLDLCSHGILLVGMKLYERGVSTGQLYAFLIASPWNSLSMTLILWALIGLPWTLLFIALSMLIAVIAGLLADRLEQSGILPRNPHQPTIPEHFQLFPAVREAMRNVHIDARDIVRTIVSAAHESGMIIRWMFLGVIIAAALRTVFSPETFSMLFGPTLLGLGATLVFATILEVCSEGSSPVAADFLLRAQAPGNSFAFLMTGVATDYTEILSIKDTTKSWKKALFLPLLTVPQVIFIAYLLNQVGT